MEQVQSDRDAHKESGKLAVSKETRGAVWEGGSAASEI